jgi:hypothetical protein
MITISSRVSPAASAARNTCAVSTSFYNPDPE